MGWETRSGRRYYYRTERCESGGLRNVYVGGGRKGQLAAREDRLAREHRKERMNQLDALMSLIGDLGAGTEAVLAAELAMAGWKRRQREWMEPCKRKQS